MQAARYRRHFSAYWFRDMPSPNAPLDLNFCSPGAVWKHGFNRQNWEKAGDRNGINDFGQIVGSGRIGGKTRAFLLSPLQK